MARPEAEARDAYLAAIGAIPGIFVCRCEVVLNAYHLRSLPDGFPDVLLLMQGHVILEEWKSLTGKQGLAQKIFERVWVATGGTYWVCRDPAEVVLRMLSLATGETRARLMLLTSMAAGGNLATCCHGPH